MVIRRYGSRSANLGSSNAQNRFQLVGRVREEQSGGAAVMGGGGGVTIGHVGGVVTGEKQRRLVQGNV
eukprot:3904804-Pyramimonas_sp.AAC.1